MAKEEQSSSATTTKKPHKTSVPSKGYVCKICSKAGHWIQQCPDKKKKKKSSANNHVPVPGVDPSTADIDEARAMQKIKPPLCDCGIISRLSKVKQSKKKSKLESDEQPSRAVGKYFFFCAKARDDDTKCRFAQLAERPGSEESETTKKETTE